MMIFAFPSLIPFISMDSTKSSVFSLISRTASSNSASFCLHMLKVALEIPTRSQVAVTLPSDFLRTSRASLFLRFLRYAGALLFRAMSTPDSPRSSNSLSLTPCFFLLFTVIRFLFQLSFLCTKRLTIYACYNFERANLCYFCAEKYKFIALFFGNLFFHLDTNKSVSHE